MVIAKCVQLKKNLHLTKQFFSTSTVCISPKLTFWKLDTTLPVIFPAELIGRKNQKEK